MSNAQALDLKALRRRDSVRQHESDRGREQTAAVASFSSASAIAGPYAFRHCRHGGGGGTANGSGSGGHGDGHGDVLVE